MKKENISGGARVFNKKNKRNKRNKKRKHRGIRSVKITFKKEKKKGGRVDKDKNTMRKLKKLNRKEIKRGLNKSRITYSKNTPTSTLRYILAAKQVGGVNIVKGF